MRAETTSFARIVEVLGVGAFLVSRAVVRAGDNKVMTRWVTRRGRADPLGPTGRCRLMVAPYSASAQNSASVAPNSSAFCMGSEWVASGQISTVAWGSRSRARAAAPWPPAKESCPAMAT